MSDMRDVTWWDRERSREFTRLECGLLGALLASVGLGFIVTMAWFFFG